MNYTENYHLPQWEENDRIMRTDFNQMCADMEAGLTENREATQIGDSKLENKTFGKLCRLAYNHHQIVRAMESIPVQKGVFWQDAGISVNGVSGLDVFDGYPCLNFSDGASAEALSKTIKVSSQLSVQSNGNSTPLSFTFTAPCNGTLQKIGIKTTSQCTADRYFTCIVTLDDLTTGRSKTSQATFVFPSGTYTSPGQHPILNLNFHQGRQYRVTFTPPATSDTISSTLLTNDVTMTCSVTGSTGSVTHTFQNPEGALGALVTVELTAGSDILPLLIWNGAEEVPLAWTREVTDNHGIKTQEAVFARNEPVKSGDTAQLQFNCPKGREIVFYGWGVTLI